MRDRARAAQQPDFFRALVGELIRGVYDACGADTTVETTDTSAYFVVGGRAEYEIHVTEADVVRVCRRIVKRLDAAFEYRAAVARRGRTVAVRLTQFGEREEERTYDGDDPDAVGAAARFVLAAALGGGRR